MAYRFTARKQVFDCPTLAAVSKAYCELRDRLDVGASQLPSANVYQNGKPVGHVSYNGRIWAGKAREWSTKTALLFDNR